jgi:LPXTG-motif cell wall-anchored protein
MLNVKYIIQKDEQGQDVPMENPNANGNAWFVSEVKLVNSADAEMKGLDKLDTKKTAIVNQKDFAGAVKTTSFAKDSLATIQLDIYKPNHLKYTSNNTNAGLAVFSEIYYPKGWIATVDGKATDIFCVDYVLRAINVPAGKHTIEFKFEPQVVQTGSMISLFSFIGMLLLLGGGIFMEVKKRRSGQ